MDVQSVKWGYTKRLPCLVVGGPISLDAEDPSAHLPVAAHVEAAGEAAQIKVVRYG
jgi:hypothetical protein